MLFVPAEPALSLPPRGSTSDLSPLVEVLCRFPVDQPSSLKPPHVDRTPSVRVLVILALTLPVAIIALVLIILSSTITSRIVEADAQRRLESESLRAQEMIRSRIGYAVRQSRLYVKRIQHTDLPLSGDLTAWEPMMFDRLATGDEVASVCYGSVNGESTYLMQVTNRLRLGRGKGPGHNQTAEYTISATTNQRIEDPENKIYDYDPRTRPWYTNAVEAKAPVWTDIYSWFQDRGDSSVFGIGYATPIYGKDKTLKGVLVIDVTLSEISRFLGRISQGRNQTLMVFDQQGLLVAGSGLRSTDDDGKRFSQSQVLPGVTNDSEFFQYTHNATPMLARSEWFSVADGLRWRIVTMVSEDSLLADSRWLMRLMFIISACFLIAGVAAAYTVSGWLTKPVYQLIGHIRSIGQGDLDTQVNLDGVREFHQISDELNGMSSKLKKHISVERSLELARQVQQSLLPGKNPDSSSLDIHGHSVYCEATGGDYYDFIQTPDGSRLTIAIGDVMGHGIAAALLMATARAALRMGATRVGDLGRLMSELNDILAADASHGRFMTMTIAQVDPQAGTVRWASAGHDPVIHYRPSTDTFLELEGASVPLGIVQYETYEEYRYSDLKPGDILFFGTDGVWEAHGPSEALFGKQRLKDAIRSAVQNAPDGKTPSAKTIATTLDQALTDFTQNVTSVDDITYIVVICNPLTPAQ
jgi:phosphoserine phosphatase RsbU/P